MKAVKCGQVYFGTFGRYAGGTSKNDWAIKEWWLSHGSYCLEILTFDKFIFTFQSYKVLPNGTRIAYPTLRQARKSELAHEVKMSFLVLERLTIWERLARFFFGQRPKVIRLVSGKRHAAINAKRV